MLKLVKATLLGVCMAGVAQAQFLDVTPVPEAEWAEPGSVTYLQNERAKMLYASGQYEEARAIWESLVSYGNLEAHNNLGVYYREGKAGPADYEKAVALWQVAAEQNFAPSLMNLAWLYRSGYPGHPADKQKAFETFVVAGRAGEDLGAYTAAQMAFNGEGIASSFADGHRLLILAADLGNANAFITMGKFDELGLNPDGDLLSARDWYEKADAMGHPMASDALAALPPLDIDFATTLMREGRHVEARNLAYRLCWEQNDPYACELQGRYDLLGADGVYRDYVSAAMSLERACNVNVADACVNFAHAVAEGSQLAPEKFSQLQFRKAENSYAAACDHEQNYNACAGVVFFNYYPYFGLNSRERIMKYGARGCINGGNQFACDVWMPMFNASVPAVPRERSNSGFGNFLGNTLTAVVGGLAAGAEAYNSGNTGSSGYSGSSYSSASTSQSSAASMRDFNQYLNSVKSIGTAYSAPCPPSNPYC
ncbi:MULTISPECIES: tetratricopeptide repeat protein [Henriciella]|jgi:TPR repeat protein|uniref:tetratricopeptide repeat protein n=1 Tax=Henriciella TaxID=453849 RepID=UPI003516FA14